MTDVGCVVLTMGDRPVEVDRAVRSVLAQRGVTVDLLVVGNGWTPTGLPEGVRALGLAENVGIPAARNIGARAVDGEVLMFLDDDAEVADPDVFAAAVGQLRADPALGVVQARIVDPEGLPTPQRHVPRLGGAGPDRSGDVGFFLEGVSFVRRRAFDEAGGWPDPFWYAHEAIELAWRVVDAGYRIRYDAGLTIRHPATPPTRHADYRYLNARNRVWVARRNLPHPLLEVYVAVWALLTFARIRAWRDAQVAARGFVDGMRQSAGPRRPIRWRAAWRLTKAGRPPIV